MPLTETGQFETPNGSKYLQQLCKHFAHKVIVEYDDEEGLAALPAGPARLYASATGLRVEITAEDAEGLIRARHVIDDHLKRFAFREGFEGMAWQAA